MIVSGPVGLRARIPDDVPVLHAELYEDVPSRIRADNRPWQPIRAVPWNMPYYRRLGFVVLSPDEQGAQLRAVRQAETERGLEATTSWCSRRPADHFGCRLSA